MLIITRANAKKNWLTQKFQSYIVKIQKICIILIISKKFSNKWLQDFIASRCHFDAT